MKPAQDDDCAIRTRDISGKNKGNCVPNVKTIMRPNVITILNVTIRRIARIQRRVLKTLNTDIGTQYIERGKSSNPSPIYNVF